VDGAQIGVLEEGDEVSLDGFLEMSERRVSDVIFKGQKEKTRQERGAKQTWRAPMAELWKRRSDLKS